MAKAKLGEEREKTKDGESRAVRRQFKEPDSISHKCGKECESRPGSLKDNRSYLYCIFCRGTIT